MRRLSLALAIAVSSALFIGHADGQQLRQPTTFRTVAFDYDSYLQEGATESPSDVPVAPSSNGNGVAPVPSACGIAPAAAGCGCDAGGCGAGGCDACGCGGCGLGLGSNLFNCCDMDDPWTLSGHFCEEPLITIGGWTQWGYANRANDLFLSNAKQLSNHQSWLYAEKVAETGTCCWDWGFRADLMYGLDADDTQAFGNPPGTWDYLNGWDTGTAVNPGLYGWAMPQLYGEIARGDLSLQFGHFYTLVGYEVVTAPDNFFFSHAMTMYNSEPFTHTGALATFEYSDDITLYGGWTLGWDTGFTNFDQGNSWLGGVGYTINENASVTWISTAGNLGARGREAYTQSVVVDLTLTERLSYVFQTDYLQVDSTGEDNVGINQYLFYTVNDCISLGSRIEWWKADSITGYAPFGSTLPAGGGSFSYYEYTSGINIKPHPNLVLRPEMRFDWSPALNYDETTFAVDAYFTF
jgi:hypothetical protein